MKKLLCLLPLALILAGCPMDAFMGQPASGSAPAASTAMNLPTFLARLEAARGSALTVTEKATVGGMTQQTRGLLDSGQQRFLGVVSQTTGLDSTTLGLIFPQATQPVSQTEAASRLETRLGRQLGDTEAQAVKTAATLRNNSLTSLKSGLASRIGKTVGLDAAVVEGLLPLLGF